MMAKRQTTKKLSYADKLERYHQQQLAMELGRKPEPIDELAHRKPSSKNNNSNRPNQTY